MNYNPIMFNADLALDFLKKLAQNNNKTWFDEHRSEYQAARKEWLNFVQQLLIELIELNPEFVHLEPHKCIYRINRDVRFGKDKTPYKKNFGAFFVPGGKMSGRAGYYLHLEPGNCFLAGGMHCPDSTFVHQIRDTIANDRGTFRQIVEAKKFKADCGEILGPKLKRPPRGYDPEHPDLKYLKLKGYIVCINIPDKAYHQADFIPQTLKYFRTMQPLIDYLNAAIYTPKNIVR